MLNIAYEPETRRAVLAWDSAERSADWVRLLRHVCLDHTDEVIQSSHDSLSMPWWSFLSARRQIREVLGNYGVRLRADDATRELLARSAANEATYEKAKSSP